MWRCVNFTLLLNIPFPQLHIVRIPAHRQSVVKRLVCILVSSSRCISLSHVQTCTGTPSTCGCFAHWFRAVSVLKPFLVSVSFWLFEVKKCETPTQLWASASCRRVLCVSVSAGGSYECVRACKCQVCFCAEAWDFVFECLRDSSPTGRGGFFCCDIDADVS